MKKILIILNTIILGFTLLSCSKEKEEILYKDEIIEVVHERNFYLGVYGQSYEFAPIESRGNYLNILNPIFMDIENSKFYEGRIVEKKVIAGYIDEKTTNKLCDKIIETKPDWKPAYENLYNNYKMDFFGVSNIYEMILVLYNNNYIDIHDYDISIYSFSDGVPIEYQNKKLVFVVNYYVIELNDGRKIVSVGYCEGDILYNYFYPFVINFNQPQPLDYGNFIYQECEYANVVDYETLRNSVIVEDYDLEYISHFTYGDFINKDDELFEYLKSALRDDTPTKEYVDNCIYYFDYQKLKELLVK